MSWQLAARAAAHLAQRRLEARRSDRHRRPKLARVLVVIVIVTAPLALIIMVMGLGLAVVVTAAPAAAAGGGALGISPVVFSAYLKAEAEAPGITAGCSVDWPIIAGIWKVESDHATTGGRVVGPEGVVAPPLFGPTLDGSIPGTTVIADTDDGLLDADPVWDRAVGPAQFLPGSWRAFGQDGDADGVADPHNIFDATLATVAHLCLATPGDYTNPTELAAAVRGYNNSDDYVATVLGWIDYYRGFGFTQGVITADGLYSFPLPAGVVSIAQILATHHDYPASDLGAPAGTPVYAAHPGTVDGISTPCADTITCRCGWGVDIAGADNHTYTYCHGTGVAARLQPGITVTAGELIMTSGNTGNSVGPHLHFQIENPDGVLVCPQPLLEAWNQGIGLSPISAPTSGCTH